MNPTIRHAAASAVRLFFWSIAFFYRHPSLVLLSLIPSMSRFIQMWNELNAPFWLDLVVMAARVLLFLLIFARMSGSRLRDVSDSALWQRWQHSLKIELERNWPWTFLAQIAVFLIGLYWLMNRLIEWLLNPSFMAGSMGLIGVGTYDYGQVHHAALLFLKNMSVIPLSIVFILRMLGVGRHDRG